MIKLGSIVKLKVPCLGNPAGSIGVCYEEYDNGGRSFIFQNGNYDGFSGDEQVSFLHEIGFSPEISLYQFKNVIKLSDDYRRGIFERPLSEWNMD